MALDTRTRVWMSGLADRVLAAGPPDPGTVWTDVWADGGSQWRN